MVAATIVTFATPVKMVESSYAATSVRPPITCSASKCAEEILFLRDIEFLFVTLMFLLYSYPAVDPTDIPNGEWLCYACRCASKREILLDEKGNEKSKRSALEVLALAASLVNPREFELPKELQLPITFPGSNKVDYVSGRRGKLLSSSYNNGRQDKILCFLSLSLSLVPSKNKIKLYLIISIICLIILKINLRFLY